jgi:hypothetical protein
MRPARRVRRPRAALPAGAALAAFVLVAALSATIVLTSCSAKKDLQKATSEVGNAVPVSDFIGDWTPQQVSIDGTWNGTAGSFDVHGSSQGGGLVVQDGAQGLTVTVVGSNGVATTPFPASHDVDTIKFVVPGTGSDAAHWELSIPDPTSGTAVLSIGTSDTWDMEKVDQIPTGG